MKSTAERNAFWDIGARVLPHEAFQMFPVHFSLLCFGFCIWLNKYFAPCLTFEF